MLGRVGGVGGGGGGGGSGEFGVVVHPANATISSNALIMATLCWSS
ncbi:MAG: hypothetical protein ACR2HJ_02230 [Fimbriimonadales bacterium]